MRHSDYTLESANVCHRTETVLRVLFLPRTKWKRFVLGLDDGLKEQAEINSKLRSMLDEYLRTIDHRLRSIEPLGDPSQREALQRRWRQIRAMVESCVESLR